MVKVGLVVFMRALALFNLIETDSRSILVGISSHPVFALLLVKRSLVRRNGEKVATLFSVVQLLPVHEDDFVLRSSCHSSLLFAPLVLLRIMHLLLKLCHQPVLLISLVCKSSGGLLSRSCHLNFHLVLITLHLSRIMLLN